MSLSPVLCLALLTAVKHCLRQAQSHCQPDRTSTLKPGTHLASRTTEKLVQPECFSWTLASQSGSQTGWTSGV
ncbi:hypothetical protein BDN67DRAFT_961092 [Paxillus ammoniavirescens]|nr:hypothetical protein BDN67DRAFT_961092 [Paxillus ammoniavirescens]